jgi:protein SCO1/2
MRSCTSMVAHASPCPRGVDPLVRTGPPGPVLSQRETAGKPTGGSAADRGVRPTICCPVVLLAAAFAAFAQPGQPAPAQQSFSMQDSSLRAAVPGALKGVGIDQRLDAQVPLNLTFTDEAGRALPLSTYFSSKKPVLFTLVYYRCPMLCSEILNGLAGALKAVTLNPGKDFEVVAVSFDPADTPEIAAAKKQSYLHRYNRPNSANGWHFLTGDEANIKALADAIGFHYKYDAATDQFAHASAIMILTPEGRLSKYFYGVEYAPRDIRLGLVEASANKIGTPVDQILLFCFHYDPATGKYGALTMNLLRAFGAGFVLIGGAVLAIALRRESRSNKTKLNLRRAG